jgi:hypothetical protein
MGLMSSQTEEQETFENHDRKKKGFWLRIKRNFYPFLLILSSFIVILTITLMLLTKAQWFRYWVSGLIFTVVNNELQEGAKFEFKDIQFSYLLGIKLKDVSVTYKGDTIIYSKDLFAGIKISPLFRSKIVVNEITLGSPKINFYKTLSDSLWIIDKIIKPSTDTTSEPSEWLIQLKKIRFKNADLRFFDSTITFNRSKKFDLDHFRLKSLYLNMNAEIDLKKSRYKANIKELSFYDTYSYNKIKETQIEAYLDKSQITLKNMYLKTAKSEFGLNSELKNINIFDDADIEKAHFKLNVNALSLDIDEISNFIPADIPVSGNFSFSMNASGKLNHFFTKFDNLSIGNSNLNFTAKIKNVVDDNRTIDFDFSQSVFFKSNLDEIIKKLEISSIPDFGQMNINQLKGTFKMDTIFSKIDVISSLGNITGFGGINIKDTLFYSGNLKYQNLDLAKILLDPTLPSNLNGNIDFTGSGDSPESIKIKIDMNMFNSKIMNYSFNNFIINANTQTRGKIQIDTLLINFGSAFSENDSISIKQAKEWTKEKISLNGFIDVHDMKKPMYDISCFVKNINLAELLQNKNLPEFFNADFQLKGEGFEPDSINSIFNLNINDWKLRGKKLTPFNLSVDIQKLDNLNKKVQLTSTIGDLLLSGQYQYSYLFRKLLNDIDKLSVFSSEKIHNIFPEKSYESIPSPQMIFSNIPQKFDLKFSLKDNSPLKEFLLIKKLNSDLFLECQYYSDSIQTFIDVKDFSINNFNYSDSINTISVSPVKISSKIKWNITNSSLIEPDINLKINSRNGITYNDLSLSKINTTLEYDKNELKIKSDADFNDLIQFDLNSNFQASNNQLAIQFDRLNINYLNKMSFAVKEPLLMLFQNNQLTINKFKLLSDKLDLIELTGSVTEDTFKDIKLKVTNYNLEHIWEFIPKDEIEMGYELKGNLDSLIIGLNGSHEKTDIDLKMYLSKLSVGESYFGNIKTDLSHRNSNLSGNLLFYTPQKDKNRDLLKLTLRKIPVNLSLNTTGDRFYENNPIDFSVETTQFPLKILSPFITDIKNLSGFADIALNMSGKGLNNLKYNGFISYNNTQFLLDANNMNFSSEGKISFNTDTIKVEKISMKNNPNDLAGGEVITKGKIILDNLKPKEFDIKVFSNKFKILSQASMKSMPSLYGDFVVSFGPKPIRFYGTTESPYITGDINILRAALVMPNTTSTDIKKSVLKYEIKKDSTVEFTIVPDSATKLVTENLTPNKTKKKTQKIKKENSFGDLLDIDVGIKFKGRFFMTLDITGIGQLFAEIGTQNPDDELRYVMKRGSTESQIYGTDIYVKDGSSLKLIKMLDTKGTISFNKGVIDNPGLDLVASYKGQRYKADDIEKYEVKMYIKGTKNIPVISFGYSINDVEGTGDSSRINENALLLLTLGKTKDELQNSQTSGGMDLKASASASATSLASTVASSALTDFVQATSFIQSADIDIGSSLQNLDQARMKFSGDIKGIKWTLGGSVAQFANSNEISIDFPVSSFLNVKGLNIVFQLTKITTSAQPSTSKNQKDFEIKFKVGGSW